MRRVSQSSFRFKNTVPIFPAEKTRNDGSGMVMGVLRRTWLTDSVDSMKVYILCVYVQPVLDDIINGVSAVLVFLLRYIHKSDSFFVKTSCKHNVNTCFAFRSTFYLPEIRTNYGKFNIRFNGPKLWNELDERLSVVLPINLKKN